MSSETAMTFGYTRVSNAGKDEALDLDALEQARCDRVFTDHASGVARSRPALDDLVGMVRRSDTLVIWRIDRHGRSLRHLLEVVGDLEQRGVALRSLTECIDTSSPAGRLVLHVRCTRRIRAELDQMWDKGWACGGTYPGPRGRRPAKRVDTRQEGAGAAHGGGGEVGVQGGGGTGAGSGERLQNSQ